MAHYLGCYYRESPCHSSTKGQSLDFARKGIQRSK